MRKNKDKHPAIVTYGVYTVALRARNKNTGGIECLYLL